MPSPLTEHHEIATSSPLSAMLEMSFKTDLHAFQNGSLCIKDYPQWFLLEGQKKGAVFQQFSECKKYFKTSMAQCQAPACFPTGMLEPDECAESPGTQKSASCLPWPTDIGKSDAFLSSERQHLVTVTCNPRLATEQDTMSQSSF